MDEAFRSWPSEGVTFPRRPESTSWAPPPPSSSRRWRTGGYACLPARRLHHAPWPAGERPSSRRMRMPS